MGRQHDRVRASRRASITVRLTVDGKTQTQTFEVKKDPRLDTTPEEYAKQLSLSLQVRDKLTETNDGGDPHPRDCASNSRSTPSATTRRSRMRPRR